MELHLHLKGKYFDEIKAGIKTEEYRLCTEYWEARLGLFRHKRPHEIILYRGFPKNTQTDKILRFPWNGVEVREIIHPEFGDKPVFVFAIKLEANK